MTYHSSGSYNKIIILEHLFKIMSKQPYITSKLIAPCGMNCGICSAYLREKNTCPGCREDDAGKAISVVKCRIKSCEKLQDGKSKFCFKCEQYPCARIKHIDKRYRTRYGMSMIENLKNIKQSGIRQFVKDEKTRWACSKCRGTICVHKGYCFSCGEKMA